MVSFQPLDGNTHVHLTRRLLLTPLRQSKVLPPALPLLSKVRTRTERDGTVTGAGSTGVVEGDCGVSPSIHRKV
jgi:hypothetical protein